MVNKSKGKGSIFNNAIKQLSSNLNSSDSKKHMNSRELELRNRSLFNLMNDKSISTEDFRDALLFRLNDIKKYGIVNTINIYFNFGRIVSFLITVYLYFLMGLSIFWLLRIFELNSYSWSDIILVSGIALVYLIYLYFKLYKEVQIVFPYLKYIYFGKYRLKKDED